MNSSGAWGGFRLIGGGLRFECRGCGACCAGPGGFVFLTEEEGAAIATVLDMPLADFFERFTQAREGRIAIRDAPNGDCRFLGPGGCVIYPARPWQCRSWPFWFSNLRSEEAWQRVTRSCPGIGQGRLHDPEEILRWMNNVKG